MRTLTAFLVTVVLTVILPITDEALVDAEAILAVVAGSGAEQRICCCEGRTEQITREVSQSLWDAQDSWLAFPYFWQNFKNCHRNEPLSLMRDVRKVRGGENQRKLWREILGCKMLALGLQARQQCKVIDGDTCGCSSSRTHVSLESC